MRIQLAPGVPDLTSLGARTDGSVFVDDPGLPTDHAERAPSGDGLEVVRYPLPGTPDPSGRLTGLPSGIGTGFVVLRRFAHAPMGGALRARFTNPRSLSLAEREWNLFCHLRQHGVSTPEPLAVGSDRGALFARRSFLIVRELDDLRSLAQCAAVGLDPRERVLIARAVGLALERVFRCGVILPNLDAHSILVGRMRTEVSGAETCAAQQIAALRTRAPIPGVDPRLKWGRLPEVAIADVRGGRIVERVRFADRLVVLDALCASLAALTDVERASGLRIVRHALGSGAPRAEKRTWLAGRTAASSLGPSGA